jgi:hypothetical protein
MPYHLKAGIAATASIATMAYTKYGSGGGGNAGSGGPARPSPQHQSQTKQENIHAEAVRHMHMWKC